eukprot:1181274-Prorocentrum_minimum.AAC.2
MALQYVPNFNRFVFDDLTTKYYSSCQFENYMWHHAMITINETGFGQMIIDGEVSNRFIPLCSTFALRVRTVTVSTGGARKTRQTFTCPFTLQHHTFLQP